MRVGSEEKDLEMVVPFLLTELYGRPTPLKHKMQLQNYFLYTLQSYKR